MRRLTAAVAALFSLLCVTVFGGALPVQTASAADVEIHGLDVSKYQEEIDWEKVAAGGFKFVIIRCCKIIRAYNDWETDEAFERNYAGAKAAGLAVGAYMFTDAASTREFTEDVAYMLDVLKGKTFEFPVFLDLESPTRQEHLSPKVFMPALLSGLQQIEDAGHTAGVYSSTAFFMECIDRKQLRDQGYAIWEANYYDTYNGLDSHYGHDLSEGADMWQYSGNGRAPGISTIVDRNICYSYKYFSHAATLTAETLPTGFLRPGAEFTVGGTITSNNVLRTITGTIHAADVEDDPLQTVTVYPHAREYRLAGFFTKKLSFSDLPAGDYVLRITGVDSAGYEIDIAESEFTVGTPDKGNQPGQILDPASPAYQQDDGGHGFAPAKQPKKGVGLGLRMTAWLYRNLPARKLASALATLSMKLGLERTPLHRILAGYSRRMELRFLASNLLMQCKKLEAENNS